MNLVIVDVMSFYVHKYIDHGLKRYFLLAVVPDKLLILSVIKYVEKLERGIKQVLLGNYGGFKFLITLSG